MDYLQNIKDFLDEKGVNYEVMHHEPAYTAQEVAQSQHVPGRMMAKSVVVKCGGEYIMCIVPATHHVDFLKICAACGEQHAELASEEELADLFPECEIGAEPPFTLGHHISLIADDSLEVDEEIVFNAGTHRDTIKMRYEDWKLVAHPQIASVAVHN